MTQSVSIDVSEFEAAAAALEQLDELLREPAGDTIDELGDATLAAVKTQARRHYRTGELDRNIRISGKRIAGTSSSVTIEAGGRIAPIIVGGSRPHIIRPMRSHALRLAGAGPVSGFASRVRHPGTAPDPFFARGVRAADTDTITDRGARRAADKLAAAIDGG